MAVKTIKAQPVAPLVRLAEVLAEVAGDGSPDVWHAEAERLAETMRGQVTRDWRGHPCLDWVDAERLLLRMRRDRAQLHEEIEQRAIEADQRFRAGLPRGLPVDAVPVGVSAGLAMMLADPMQGSRRESMVEHALRHPSGALIFHPVNEQADQ